jgi:hypothetical protein
MIDAAQLSKPVQLPELSIIPSFGTPDVPTCRLVIEPKYPNPLVRHSIVIDLRQN